MALDSVWNVTVAARVFFNVSKSTIYMIEIANPPHYLAAELVCKTVVAPVVAMIR